MSYIYRVDGTQTVYETLGDLSLRIEEDFPRIGFSHLLTLKDELWDMSPGDYLEERELGFTVMAR